MPSEAELICDQGYALLEAGRTKEAHALLARARGIDPGNPVIHYRLALLYADTDKPEKALLSLDTTLRLQPENARAHNNRGSALQILGRVAEAEAAFRSALRFDPDLEQPYANLGHLLEERGRYREAIELYERALGRGMNHALFGHHIAAASGKVTTRAPEGWVRATFDNFAPMFDTRLQALGYEAPRRLADMLRSHAKAPLDILDLGCGTGLCGVALASMKHRMTGVDLSEKMLDRARARGVYDELHVEDLEAFLHAAATASYDVVVAADVFIYIGALENLFREAARVLRPHGWFAFSTEESAQLDYVLLPTGRYAQAHAYVLRLAQPSFAVVGAEPAAIRTESGVPLGGRLYLLRRALAPTPNGTQCA